MFYKVQRLLLFVCLTLCAKVSVHAACTNLNLSFTNTAQNGCGVPQNIVFDNTSTGTNANNNVKYYWRVNGVLIDSTINTGPNFNYAFLAPGTYTVRMIARTAGNCRDSIQHNITITSASPQVYNATATLTYQPVWNNCILNPLQNDNYTVNISSNVVLNNYTILWGDGPATASGASLPIANIVSHTYTTLGAYTVKIITENSGCFDTLTGLVYNMRPVSTSIKPLPAGQLAGCAPHTITFQDSTQHALPGTVLTWNFGDGTIITRDWTQANMPISHTYLPVGLGNCVYTVSLRAFNVNCNTGPNNASTYTISPILIFDKDQAGINPPANLCLPSLTYTFGNSSVDNCITGQRLYYWDFGDGTNTGWITSKAAQTHTFPDYGSYTIMLIDSNGCGSDTAYAVVVLNTPPQVGFTVAPKFGCAPLTINLNDTSLGIGNSRVWNLSGGSPTSSTIASPSTTYNNPGTYIVRLTVSNVCSSNIIKRDTIRVYARPIVQMGNVTSGCVPHTFTPVNNTINQSPTATYFWDFGNSQTSTAKNPGPITYNSTGTFSIKLVVTDTCGKDSQTISIAVSTLPTASFSADTVCRTNATNFIGNSTLALGDVITEHKWYFGNGDSATTVASTQNYIYPTHGTYNAVLKITTDKNCVDRDTIQLEVKPSPIVSFSNLPTIICDKQAVTFNGTATTTGPGNITQHRWSFGTGDSAKVEDTSYVFPTYGSYLVTYTAVNNLGCFDTSTKTINVRPNPVARLFRNNSCSNQFTQFTDSSTVAAGSTITQWDWDFDNNGVTDSTTQHPSYKFTSANSFNTKLKVTTNFGCHHTDSIITVVNASPTANFNTTNTSVCLNDSFVFNNLSIGSNLFKWNFGEVTTNVTDTVVAIQKYKYTDTGTYWVKLQAQSLEGCKDSIALEVNSRPLPKANFVINDSIGCAPFNFTFNNTSTLANSYLWLVNNIQSSTQTNRADTLINLSGQIVNIKLIALNQYNCKPDTAIKTLYTFGNPIPNFTMSKDSGCGPMEVAFTNTTPNGINYVWELGNGETSTNTNANSIYTAALNSDSIFTIKLIAINGPGCADSISKTVRVFPNPKSIFTPNINTGCGPLGVTFNNVSTHNYGGTQSNMSFAWQFGNGQLSAQTNPTNIFNASAIQDTIYTTKLIAFSRFGCSDTSTANIRVYPNAKARFVLNNPAGCGPLNTGFTNTSIPNDTGTIGIMSFAWLIGNGQTSTQVNPSTTYLASNTIDSVYQVRLIALSEHGCRDTAYQTARVYPKPKARFTQNNLAGCGPLNVQFTNTSIPNDTGSINIMSFVWQLGNGNSTITQNAASSYVANLLTDSVYQIKLQATSEHGCIDTTSSTVRVHPKPITSFINNKNTGCGPLNVQFTNTSQLAAKYYWQFGTSDTSSKINPSYVFSSYPIYDSVYTVLLATQSQYGCLGDTVSTSIIARYTPVANYFASNDSICGTGNIAFFNASLGGVQHRWNFGNGQLSSAINPASNFTALPTKDTTYLVQLVTTSPYGCSDTFIKPVTVNALPDAAFANVTAACTPYKVLFNNTSVRGVNYLWDFGDATTDTTKNATKTFENNVTLVNRIYPVTLTAYSKSGCIDTAKRNVTVYPLPIARFVANNPTGCGPLTTGFTNTSTPNDTTIASFAWRFGNGQTSTQASPSTTYLASKTKDTTYQIRLIATSQFGCKDTTYQTTQVYPKPKAAFTQNNTVGCGPLGVQFTNTSTSNDSGATGAMSYVWNLGNGNFANTLNASTTYVAGFIADTVYQIKLQTSSVYGCIDTISSTVRIHPKPITSFTKNKSEGCGPLNVQFTNTSQLATKYYWKFGTIDTSSNTNPSYVFSSYPINDSVYQVLLATQSQYGCLGDTVSTSIIARYLPIANYFASNDSICGTGNVAFFNTSTGGVQNQWAFGNGLTSTAINPASNYTALPTKDTTYFVRLVTSSPYGCKDTLIKPIKVNALPDAAFANVTAACTPYKVVFNNTSLRGVNYLWDFGDATTDTTKNATKTFENNITLVNRVYPVTLTAFSKSGCIDTAKRNITVYPLPNASFSANKSLRCDTTEYNFNNSTQGASNYLWSFGDGQTSTLQSPKHFFRTKANIDSNYYIRMVATSANGCKDTAQTTVIAHPLVSSDFEAAVTSGCLNLDVAFINKSFNATNYFWLFGDGAGSNDSIPKHAYSNAGAYHISLIAYDKFGCSDTTTKTSYINIYEIPKAQFVYLPGQPQVPNTTVNFSDRSYISNGALFYNWNFGDPNSANNTSNLQNPTHTFTDSGSYQVRLVVSSINGCRDTIVKSLYVFPQKPSPDFDYTPKEGCKPLLVNFTNLSKHANAYEWDFGDGNTSAEENPTHIYTRDDTYTVRLKSFGPGGDSTIVKVKIITVHDLPRARFIAAPTAMFLPNATAIFTNTSFDAYRSVWRLINQDSQTIFTDTNTNSSYAFTTSGIYSLELIVMNQFGCTDTAYSKDIIRIENNGAVYVPSAFSPNGDGINETFFPVKTGVKNEDYLFRVYDRWGKSLFETTDVNLPWDGTDNGDVDAVTETYVWLVEGVFVTGERFAKKGTVTLLR